MKKILPFLSFFGMIIMVSYILIDHFLFEIPNEIGIPLLVITIIMMITGNLYNKSRRKKLMQQKINKR